MSLIELLPPANYRLYTLAPMRRWSRYILNYLYAISSDSSRYSITASCSLTSTEYGLLTGYGFSATFVVTGLFMGRAADSNNRRNIIVIGCFIWNGALAGMGSSTVFWELLMYRLFLGFGQAFSNPASYSMISDLFIPDHRPMANGLFATGCYIGGGMASLSETIAESIGWRMMVFICAAVGAGVATVMMLTMFEPLRQGTKETKDAAGEEKDGAAKAAAAADVNKPSIWEAIVYLFTDVHTALLLLGASVRYMGGYAIAGYLPTFYESKWLGKTSAYSEINAFVVAFGGFLSSFIGGKVTSAWLESAKNPDPSARWLGAEKANYYVPMIGCLAAIPFMLIALYSSNFYISLCVGLLGEYLTAECWFGPYMSALTSGVPSQMRATAVATMMFTATFMGSLISYIIGVLYDYYATDKSDGNVSTLTWLLLGSVVGTYALSAQLFFVASRYAPTASKAKAPKDASTEKTPLLGGVSGEGAA